MYFDNQLNKNLERSVTKEMIFQMAKLCCISVCILLAPLIKQFSYPNHAVAIRSYFMIELIYSRDV